VWNVKQFKRVLADFKLDVSKLPLGSIHRDKIKKSHAVLLEIQKLLIKEGTSNLKTKS
jgi:hypothetical protein